MDEDPTTAPDGGFTRNSLLVSGYFVAWLRTQLDEDEAVAWDVQNFDHLPHPRPYPLWPSDDVSVSCELTWAPHQATEPHHTPHIVLDAYGDGVAVPAAENLDAQGVTAHIARHDPARVLADITAKRAILQLWEHTSARRREGVESEARAWLMDQVVAALVSPHTGSAEPDNSDGEDRPPQSGIINTPPP